MSDDPEDNRFINERLMRVEEDVKELNTKVQGYDMDLAKAKAWFRGVLWSMAMVFGILTKSEEIKAFIRRVIGL